jgi:hypothetical protein
MKTWDEGREGRGKSKRVSIRWKCKRNGTGVCKWERVGKGGEFQAKWQKFLFPFPFSFPLSDVSFPISSSSFPFHFPLLVENAKHGREQHGRPWRGRARRASVLGLGVCTARGMPSASMHRIDLYGVDVHARVCMGLVCASRTYMV